MGAEQNIKDNTSNKEVLSKNSKTVAGDIYVQDVHKSFDVTKALDGVILVQILVRFMPLLVPMAVEKARLQK